MINNLSTQISFPKFQTSQYEIVPDDSLADLNFLCIEKFIGTQRSDVDILKVIASIQKYLLYSLNLIQNIKLLIILHLLLEKHHSAQINIAVFSVLAAEKQRARSYQKYYPSDKIEEIIVSQVMVPYINYILKFNENEQICLKILSDSQNLPLGFSLLNRLREISAFRFLFHRMSIYYKHHAYICSIYKAIISNTKKYLSAICQMADKIVLEIQKDHHKIQYMDARYLFLKQAEAVHQTILILYYEGDYHKKMAKSLRITDKFILSDKIEHIYKKNKRLLSFQQIKYFNAKKLTNEGAQTRKNHQEKKMNTEMRIEVLDSISQLEIFIRDQ